MSPVVIKIDFVDLQSTVYKAVYQEIWAFSKWMEKEGKTFFFAQPPWNAALLPSQFYLSHICVRHPTQRTAQ